ncbi:MAG: linear amide C-N hydrolase [Synechococcaceae bacterium WB8_1B_136]|nr:linear amide C-N hydrolase [Synechococcaceae bacterium WB8_1B_136]
MATPFRLKALLTAACLGVLSIAPAALACSRVTWVGPDQQVITGRSMDWPYGFNSHFYVIPRGERIDGAGGLNSLSWTSRFGSVVLSGSTEPGGPIDAVFDGVNERGLAANLLYLAENDFGLAGAGSGRPRLSFAAWTLYLLSEYATVKELVAAVKADRIQIVPVPFGPGGKAKATVHMAVSDASGDSAVIEYLKGKPVIHHGPEYQVMTNSPIYSEQLKLNAFWATKDRNQELPGSIQSPDRFVRGSYYVQQLPSTRDGRQALAGVMSVMRNISVPWGTPDPEHPNISPTWWRSLIDQKNQVYYFDSALSPQMVWLNLRQLDFKPGSGVRAVKIEGNDTLQGNAMAQLQPASSIRFLAPK